MTMINTTTGSIHSQSKGQGTHYLWSHGLTHSIETEQTTGLYDWSSLAERCQMVRYDALGHGRSGGSTNPDDYRWSRLADDIFQVADYYQFDEFIAGGASMGCAASIYAALKNPARIKGLVLVIPPTAWQTRQSQINIYEKLALMIESKGMDGYLRQQRLSPVSPPLLAELSLDYKQLRTEELKKMNPTYLPAIYRGAGMSDLPDLQTLTTIECPVLVLAWEKDAGHPVSTAETLLRTLPNAEGSIAASAAAVREWPNRIGEFIESIG